MGIAFDLQSHYNNLKIMEKHPNFIKDPINYNKKGEKRTGMGKFLAGLGKNVAPKLIQAVGLGDIAGAIGIVSDDPDNAGLTQEQAQMFFKMAEMELQDRANARAMQTAIATSKESGWFAKNYVYLLSSLIVLAAIIFGIGLMYVEIPDENKRLVEMFADIFLFSGALTIIQFFFGSSKGSKDKADKLRI